MGTGRARRNGRAAGAATTLAAALAATLLCAPVQAADDETPFWAVGRPANSVADAMAPIAAPPIPLPEEDLPKLQVPEGFKVEVFKSGVLDARTLREGDSGVIFVSSLFVAGKLYAITPDGEVKTIASDLMLPSGIALKDGDLYLATPKEILRYPDIEAHLDDPPTPEVVVDDLPGDIPHGWKFIEFGPDGRLYYPVGAPCNICESDEVYTKIYSINPDGSDRQVVADGMRSSVGMAFNPVNGDLFFTDNQRDWLAEDMPQDELNRVTKPGEQHFGYPYCHSGLMTDPQYGWGHSCDDYTAPAALLGPHAAPLGVRFYTGDAFPEKYRNALFIARHGGWNLSTRYADVAVAFLDDSGAVASVEPFITGFVDGDHYIGRPADVMVMKDGSLLVSDDHAGAIYRVTYGE